MKTTIPIPTPMTDDEVIAVGDEIDRLLHEIGRLGAQWKHESKGHREDIKQLAGQLKELSGQRMSRMKPVDTDVEIAVDLDSGEERTVRTDTGEVVETRTLSDVEVDHLRQTNLGGVE